MMLLACLSAIAPVFATRVNFGGLLQPSGKALHLTRPIRLPFRYTPSVSQAAALPVKTRVELTEEVEDAARKIFNTIDANSDGEISRVEMIRAFRRNRDLWERFKLNLWNELKLKTFNSMQSVKDGEFTGDGTVSFEEFSTEFMKTADIDGDGTVSFEEFRTFLSQIDDAEDFAGHLEGTAKSSVSAESVLDSSSSLFELMFMFENIDVDKDGQLTKKELKMASKNSKLFKKTMNVKSYRDATKLVEGADTDGDGTVSFDEFKSYLVSSYSKEFLEYLDSGRDQVHSPRKNKHASVIVLREVDDDLQVLVRLQSSGSDQPRLSLLSGKKQEGDADSRVTALREVAEGTGLVDLIGLDRSPDWLLQSMRHSNMSLPPSPQSFFMFDIGEHRDWWVLKIGGPGVFLEKRFQNDVNGLVDMNTAISSLPEDAEIAQCFGHAWIPVKSLKKISDSMPKIGGAAFDLKVFKAAVALRRNKQRLDNTASIWQTLDTLIFGTDDINGQASDSNNEVIAVELRANRLVNALAEN